MSDPVTVVATAREAFNGGTTKPIKYRLTVLKNFIKFLGECEKEIVSSICRDIRKHQEEARSEIIIAVNHLRYLIRNLPKWDKPEKPSKRLVDIFEGLYIHHDPYGVVLVMGAWNIPLLSLVPVAGAIAAGNCVVIKPSHNSPAFSDMLVKFLPKYLDSDSYPVFVGDIDQTTLLLEQRFDYIYYTGSIKVAKLIHQAANKYLTPTTLELGGKNPVYIDSTANLQLTAERVMWGKCFNSGHTCIAPDYILCDKDVEKLFVEYAKKALFKFYGEDPKCPIVNDHHFRRLVGLMYGLTVAIGGRTYPLENYIEPTVAIKVTPDDPIMQEEIFGPILPIVTVHSMEEAVNFINNREKPLALYVFTQNSAVQNYFLKNTSCGGVTVNDTLLHLTMESLPFGGVGFSGMGRYKGRDSYDTFVHKKGVLVRNFCKMPEIIARNRYPPYSSRKTNFLAFVLRERWGPSWGWINYAFIFILGFIAAVVVFKCLNVLDEDLY